MTLLPSGLADAAWFTRLGLPLSACEHDHMRAYLDAADGGAASVHRVASWLEAERIARDPAWDRSWWTREEAERVRLMAIAGQRLGARALLQHLSAAAVPATEAIHAAATNAAERDDITDAGLVRAASGAAAMALHAAALAAIADQGSDHPFMRKYVLFQDGRWPLGIVGGTFHLF